MLAITLLMILAVSGGLFTGTILYSVIQNNRIEQAIDLAEKLWPILPQ